jgi:hypothetical protein
MKRRIFGIWRSIAICRAPDAAEPLLAPCSFFAPRSRFSSAMAPPFCCPSIEKLPMRVRRMTSPADMQPIMASQWSRRACRAGSTAWI